MMQQQQVVNSGMGRRRVPVRHVSSKSREPHYCETCKIICVGGTQKYKEHLEGQKHKKKEARPGPEQVRCELCDLTCPNADFYQDHINGKKHQKVKKLHQELGKPLPSMGPIQVKGGESGSGSSAKTGAAEGDASIAAEHVQGQKHKKMEAQAKISTSVEMPKAGVWKCQLCDITSPYAKFYQTHINGKKHRQKVKKQCQELRKSLGLPLTERVQVKGGESVSSSSDKAIATGASATANRRSKVQPVDKMTTTRTVNFMAFAGSSSNETARGDASIAAEHLQGQKHKKEDAQAKITTSVESPRTNMLKCQLCDITCPNAKDYQAHINGKKHRKVKKRHQKLFKPIPSTEPIQVKRGSSTLKAPAGGQMIEQKNESPIAAVSSSSTSTICGVVDNNIGDNQQQRQPTPLQEFLNESDVQPVGHEYMEEVRKEETNQDVRFYCMLCDCPCYTPTCKEEHMKGRRHRLRYKQKVDADPEFLPPSCLGIGLGSPSEGPMHPPSHSPYHPLGMVSGLGPGWLIGMKADTQEGSRTVEKHSQAQPIVGGSPEEVALSPPHVSFACPQQLQQNDKCTAATAVTNCPEKMDCDNNDCVIVFDSSSNSQPNGNGIDINKSEGGGHSSDGLPVAGSNDVIVSFSRTANIRSVIMQPCTDSAHVQHTSMDNDDSMHVQDMGMDNYDSTHMTHNSTNNLDSAHMRHTNMSIPDSTPVQHKSSNNYDGTHVLHVCTNNCHSCPTQLPVTGKADDNIGTLPLMSDTQHQSGNITTPATNVISVSNRRYDGCSAGFNKTHQIYYHKMRKKWTRIWHKQSREMTRPQCLKRIRAKLKLSAAGAEKKKARAKKSQMCAGAGGHLSEMRSDSATGATRGAIVCGVETTLSAAVTCGESGSDSSNKTADGHASIAAEHLQGEKHKKEETQAKATTSIETPRTNQLKCRLCGIICPTAKDYQAHIIGKKHHKVKKRHQDLFKPMMCGESGSDSSNKTADGDASIAAEHLQRQMLKCRLCGITCPTAKDYQAHIIGKKHRKVKKRHKKLFKPIPSTEPIQVMRGESGNSSLDKTIAASASATANRASKVQPVEKVTATQEINLIGSSTLKAPAGGQMIEQKNESPIAAVSSSSTSTICGVVDNNIGDNQQQRQPTTFQELFNESDVQAVGHEYIEEVRREETNQDVRFYCMLCDCQLYTPMGKEEHMKGRRHRLRYKQKVDADPEFLPPSCLGIGLGSPSEGPMHPPSDFSYHPLGTMSGVGPGWLIGMKRQADTQEDSRTVEKHSQAQPLVGGSPEEVTLSPPDVSFTCPQQLQQNDKCTAATAATNCPEKMECDNNDCVIVFDSTSNLQPIGSGIDGLPVAGSNDLTVSFSRTANIRSVRIQPCTDSAHDVQHTSVDNCDTGKADDNTGTLPLMRDTTQHQSGNISTPARNFIGFSNKRYGGFNKTHGIYYHKMRAKWTRVWHEQTRKMTRPQCVKRIRGNLKLSAGGAGRKKRQTCAGAVCGEQPTSSPAVSHSTNPHHQPGITRHNLSSTLKTVKLLVFLDLDNWASFFKKLPAPLPPSVFVWGFHGGASGWMLSVQRDANLRTACHRDMFYLNPRSSVSKNSADVALAVEVGHANSTLPRHIPFAIVSGDRAMQEIVRSVQATERRIVRIDPHGTRPEAMLHQLTNLATACSATAN